MFERICIILLLNLVFYARTLRYKYVSDDIPVFREPLKFKNKWEKAWLQFIGRSRYDPQIEHLTTLLIHAFICVFIYLVFGKSNISFLASLFFTFNPVNNQGSIWIGGRGYTFPALSLLILMVFPLLSPILLLGGCWFTAGFLTPLVLIGSTKFYLLALIPVIWFIYLKKFLNAVFVKKNTETYAEDRKIHPRKLILALKTFGFYFSLCVFPYQTTFYHSFLQSCAGNKIMRKRAYTPDKFFWIGLASITVWVIYSLHHWDLISWAFLWFVISIAPYCNLVRVNQEIAERFVYIANIGVMVLLSSVVIHYPFMAVALLVYYATRMWFVMPMYQDDYWLTEFAVIEDPGAWYAWHNRGLKRWDTGSYHEAIIMWVMAKIISPKEFKVLMNISFALRLLKNNQEADEYLKLAQENIVDGQEKESAEFIEQHKKGRFQPLI